ncbi:hypothetical protein O181_084400 [Austropuccinia psidii MF-1]|uniref:Uncharacterized protein n=1 Tax=Austropuccinia psidii MF-1 TaxID=1389203 RepID=A0A9Q3FVJ8_9BASI|nr:hypothetical protein [Austropuccinia psidii MF-1]
MWWRTGTCTEEQVHRAMFHRRVHLPITNNGITWKKMDFKIPNKPTEPFKPNTPSTNEQTKCHKIGGTGHLANNLFKKEKMDEIVEKEDHNDKEDESDSEKDTKEPETS